MKKFEQDNYRCELDAKDVFALMARAYRLANHSPDPHTQHGCIILSQRPYRYGIIGQGYNRPLKCIPSPLIPKTRPHKYAYHIHAEINAMIDASRRGSIMHDSTAIVTGPSCPACFRALVEAGIRTFYYCETKSACINPEDEEAIKVMQQHSGAVIYTVSLREVLGHDESTHKLNIPNFGICDV